MDNVIFLRGPLTVITYNNFRGTSGILLLLISFFSSEILCRYQLFACFVYTNLLNLSQSDLFIFSSSRHYFKDKTLVFLYKLYIFSYLSSSYNNFFILLSSKEICKIADSKVKYFTLGTPIIGVQYNYAIGITSEQNTN